MARYKVDFTTRGNQTVNLDGVKTMKRGWGKGLSYCFVIQQESYVGHKDGQAQYYQHSYVSDDTFKTKEIALAEGQKYLDFSRKVAAVKIK